MIYRTFGGFLSWMLAVALAGNWVLAGEPDSAVSPKASALTIDFSRTNGTIRPIHGVNFGPLCYRGMVDLSEYHRQLALPLTRLHDAVWVNYDAVDISSLFRDFRNNPAQPENYDFAATDDYLAAIVRVGSPILYRLGESIEHTPRKYRVHPPSDFAKWADICCHVIAHYNEGWAGGFQHGIQYWEIWNEPENQPAMWTGKDEQYFELYETAAKTIKARWPGLKIGGPSLGYTGEFEGDRFKPGAFLTQFLSRCRDRHLPLDFLSWHRYAKDPAEFARRARAIRQLLDEYGFTRTESHLNEWNYLPDENWHPITPAGQGTERETWVAEMGSARAAAFAAWALISMQAAPVDMANFYTAEVQAFGMFTLNGVPRKNFYAFRAFRDLLETPLRVETPPCVSGQIACSAGLNRDRSRAAILLSNFNAEGPVPLIDWKGLPWTGPSHFECWVVDDRNDFKLVRQGTSKNGTPFALPELKAPAVVLLKLAPNAGTAR